MSHCLRLESLFVPAKRAILVPARRLLVFGLLLSVLSFSGCIVPIAPEFQDPPKQPNYEPSFELVMPFGETTVQMPAMFSVVINDPNPQDTLHVRWAADYPAYTAARSRLLVDELTIPPGATRKAELRFTSDDPCHGMVPGSDHKLVIIVADRPFRDANQFTAEFRYNLVENDRPTAMVGWNLTGCP